MPRHRSRDPVRGWKVFIESWRGNQSVGMGASAKKMVKREGGKTGEYVKLSDRLLNMQSVVRGLRGQIKQLVDFLKENRVGGAGNACGEDGSTSIECRGSPEVEDSFGIEGRVENCLFEYGPRTPSPPPAQLREATPPNSPKEFSPPPRLEREDPPSPRHHFAKDGSPPARGFVGNADRAGGSGWGSCLPVPASKHMEIVRMLERGELPGGIRVDIRAVPPNPWAPLKPMTTALSSHAWEGKVKRRLHERGLGCEKPRSAPSKSGTTASGLEANERDIGGIEFSFNVASVEPASPPKDCAFFSSAGSNPFEFQSKGSDKKDNVFVFGKGSG